MAAGESFAVTSATALDTTTLGEQDRLRLARLFRFLPFNLASGGVGNVIRFRTQDDQLQPERYRIDVTPDLIEIVAGSLDGCSLAIAVLRQLLPVDGYRRRPADGADWRIPAGLIEDAPALAWRGLLVDVARHFVPKHGLLRLIDTMADLRLNRLQLHLTDDQGWRMESVHFPLLHERGSHRTHSQRSNFAEPKVYDETPHGGFYTRADLREIVDYADDRGIIVVPEIDLPGHTGALVAAYPELGVPFDTNRTVSGDWGIGHALVSPGATTLEFLGALLDEVTDIFPSPWIHVGGDEPRLSVWANDVDTMRVANKAGMTSAGEVFASFMSGVHELLHTRGRIVITWDDAFALAPNVGVGGVIMAWRGLDVAQRATAAGRQVILSPVMPTYLDYYQADDEREPLAIDGPITLDDVARFNPLPPDWSSGERSNVLGAQAQVWTEWISTERAMDYALFPRLCAFAETVWRGGPVVDDGWTSRLTVHLERLDAYGIEYRPLSGPHAWQEGGRGFRAHHRSTTLTATLDHFAQAAENGTLAFEAPHEPPPDSGRD